MKNSRKNLLKKRKHHVARKHMSKKHPVSKKYMSNTKAIQ